MRREREGGERLKRQKREIASESRQRLLLDKPVGHGGGGGGGGERRAGSREEREGEEREGREREMRPLD